jgi:hypothetical protein
MKTYQKFFPLFNKLRCRYQGTLSAKYLTALL